MNGEKDIRQPESIAPVRSTDGLGSVKEEHWVRDDEKTRGYDGKRLLIKGRGVFMMHVRETNSKGERNPGHVQLLIEPDDLDAAMSTTVNEAKSEATLAAPAGSAIDWFIGTYPNPPKRQDGSIDFEALCGEFPVERESYKVVRANYDALPSHLKREPPNDQAHL